MNTTARFKEYLDYKKVSNYKAEQECGLSNGLLGNAFKTGSSLGSDKLENILNTYSDLSAADLSANWLLRGDGNMIIGEGIDQEQLLKSIDLPVNSREIINVWMKFMEVIQGMQDIYKQTIAK